MLEAKTYREDLHGHEIGRDLLRGLFDRKMTAQKAHCNREMPETDIIRNYVIEESNKEPCTHWIWRILSVVTIELGTIIIRLVLATKALIVLGRGRSSLVTSEITSRGSHVTSGGIGVKTTVVLSPSTSIPHGSTGSTTSRLIPWTTVHDL